MSGPLRGLRVLDLTTVLMGPYATQLLADMGADVVKIEPPAGDAVRGIGPMRNPGMGYLFLHVNRNKRSLVLDLKQPEGLEAFHRLARTADVVVYNVRPAAMRRLGIHYERLKTDNPGLICAGPYGYSERGPYAGTPAYDDLIQGACAVPDLVARASGGEPRYVPLTLADRTVGLMGSNAPLRDIDSLLEDPHLDAVGMIRTVVHPTEGELREIGVPVSLSDTPVSTRQRPAPRLGQHSAEVLLEAGFSQDEVLALQARGATAGPATAAALPGSVASA